VYRVQIPQGRAVKDWKGICLALFQATLEDSRLTKSMKTLKEEYLHIWPIK
jgi:hypothetical protein